MSGEVSLIRKRSSLNFYCFGSVFARIRQSCLTEARASTLWMLDVKIAVMKLWRCQSGSVIYGLCLYACITAHSHSPSLRTLTT